MNIFILFIFIYSVYCIPPLLIKKWANLMGDEIELLMEEGVKYKEIQKLYDDAVYEQINIDWIKQLQDIHNKLGMSFVTKKAQLDYLAQQVANFYDNSESIELPKIKSLDDLGPSIFIDSDKVRTHFNVTKTNLHDNSQSVLKSSVKLPTLVPKTNQKIIETVWWTANLEKIFKQNMERDTDIRYQYFASKTGVFRSFPIRPWETDQSGRVVDFDPRVRPWYVAAITKPKNVIIIFDASSTMVKSKSRALALTHNILNTLTNRDYLSVVISRSPYYDIDGKYHHLEPYVLGCTNQTALLPANPSFSFKLFYLLQNLEMDGGSDYTGAFRLAFNMLSSANNDLCHNLILFVTDGITLDGSQRCNAGQYYYNYDGAKKFVPGSICIFDHKKFLREVKSFQEDLKKDNLPPAYIFTFTTSEHAHSYLKQLSCNNFGMRIPVWDSKIPTAKALSPYYHFLRNISDPHDPAEQVWTSPYLDALNADLIITASKAVYSNKGKFIGVVGIDITLDTIENMLNKETWNSVSYFVIDNHGHAILHPLIKHSEELLGDPIFIHVSLLEQFDGQPAQFDEVLTRMLRREIGSRQVNQNAYIAFYNGEYQEGLSWKPVYSVDYNFGPIQGSDFSFAFRVPFSRRLFYIPTATGSTAPAEIFLTDYTGYAYALEHKKIPAPFDRPIQAFLDSLVKKSLSSVSYNYSGVHLSPRAFCSPEEYIFHNKPPVESLHIILNTPHQPQPCTSPEGLIKPTIKSDVILTSKMENVWKNRNSRMQSNIISTFLSTFNGVTRVYPALQIPRAMEPLKLAWFNKALLNVGTNIITPTFRPYLKTNTDRVLTMSRTIMLGKPLCQADDLTANEMLYSGPTSKPRPINDGCPCKKDTDCTSNYCYLNSWCTNAITHAVAGMNLKFTALKAALYDTVKTKLSPARHCNSIYPCPIDPTVSCTLSCILINNSTQIVIHPNFSSQSFLPPSGSELNYDKVYLELIEPRIFFHLMTSGIIYNFFSTDFQAVCAGNNDNPLSLEFGNPHTNTEDTARNRKYNCIKEVALFAVNNSKLEVQPDGVFSHTFNETLCLVKYFFTNVPNSNLYLIVLEDLPLIDVCIAETNITNTALVHKKEFSLCKDYSYAKRFSAAIKHATDHGIDGNSTQLSTLSSAKNKNGEENPTCPAFKSDYNEDYCSGTPHTIFVNFRFLTILLGLGPLVTLVIL